MYGIYNNGNVIAQFVTPMSVISNVPTFDSDTMSLKRNVQRMTAQRWEITSRVQPLSTDANELFALLVSKGSFDTLEVTMPQNTGAIHKRVITTAVKPKGTGDVDGLTFTVTSANTIPVGTFIRFANHSKIYLLTSKAGSIYGIYPALQSAVLDESFDWLDDVIMPVYLEPGSMTGMSYSDGILMDNGEMKFVEAL